ncbi:MAG TPA: MFS transporter [Planctomycetota bacterium]|nr:MFS transporter [Planctomycetota bacterium]
MASPVPPRVAHPALKLRLSVMMFLQYAIWGAWLPFLWSFLSEHRKLPPEQIGSLFAAGAVGAILGPFIAGQIADRYFATEKFLGISHLIGAVLIWQLAAVESFQGFLTFSLIYGLVYSPTLALTNSLAFHHLADRDRDFGKVRMWGTFGWIVVGIALGHWLGYAHTPAGASADVVHLAQVAGKADAFKLSAVLGALMGLYCFTLPSTPPTKSAKSNAVFVALGEVRRQPLLTLFLLAVPVSCIHQFYFVHTEGFLHAKLEVPEIFRTIFGVGGGGFMTIGQMVEVMVLGLIPLVAKNVSRKSLLAVGLIAYALRMALFAYMQDSGLLLLFGVGLHGLCFGCFIFVAFMIVDEETSPDVRASAQNLFNLVIIGVGIIVGSWVAGAVAEWASASGTMDYRKLFSAPMWAALVCLALLRVFYPDRQAAKVLRSA